MTGTSGVLLANIDATYVDTDENGVFDPSRQAHQQTHDVIAISINAISDPAAPDTYGTRAFMDARIAAAITAHLAAVDPHGSQAYADTQLQNYTNTDNLLQILANLATLDIKGDELLFFYNNSLGRYYYVGDSTRTVTAIVSTNPKLFFGPAAQHPKNITAVIGPLGTSVPATPVFHQDDRFKKVG